MASAYELMLVLRGRNYLSNDLRRAGADLRRMQTMGGLQNQRSQLNVNAQRLATTKQIAQNEIASLTTGTRAKALDQARANFRKAELAASTKLAAANAAVVANDEQRLANANKLSALQTEIGRQPFGSLQWSNMRMQAEKLAAVDRDLIAEQVALRDSLAKAQQQMAGVNIQEQKLIATEAEHAQRIAVLTDRINTTNAALDLNTIKMNENALAMQRLPFERLATGAKYVEHLGRMFQTLGLFAAAGMGAAAYTASKFQTGGVLAATQLTTAGNNSPQQIMRVGAAVNQQLLNFMASGRSVASAQELQRSAYDIPSGIPSLRGGSMQKARETIALIKEFNQVAKANYGLVDLEGVTKAGIILINTFGTSIHNLPHEFDVMQSAVNRGKVTLGEFVSGLSQTAPAAKAAGYTFDNMSSVLSFLSGKLPQYTRVAVGYARALELFQNKKFEDYMKSKGAAITDLTGKLLPYNQIIAQLLKVDPALAHGGNLIAFLKQASGASGFMQARRVLTVSLQDQAGLNEAIQAVPANAQGLVNKSAQALSQTGAVKWKQLTTEIKALVIEIGTGAIPVFQKLAQPIEHAVNWFNKLDPATKHMVGQILTFSAVGMLLVGTLGVFVGALGRSYSALRLFLIGRGGIANAEAGFVTAGTALRVGLIGALLIAIPYLANSHNKVTELSGGLITLKSVLQGLTVFAAFRLFQRLASTALIASRNVTGLELALTRLNGFVAVATILIVYKTQGKQAVEWLQKHLAELGVPNGPPGKHDPSTLFGKYVPGGAWLQNHTQGILNVLSFGLASQDQKDQVKRDVKQYQDAFKRFPGLTNLAGSLAYKFAGTRSTESVTKMLDRLFPELSPGAIRAAVKIAFAAYDQAVKDQRRIPGSRRAGIGSRRNYQDPAVTYSGKPPAPFTDADVMAAVRNIVKLDELASKHPSLKNYETAAAALKALQTQANTEQFAAAQQLISSLESADQAHTKKTISEAKKRANAVIAAQKKAQQEITRDAQALQQQYSSMYQSNQSAFGSLFGGPFMQGARMQDQISYGYKPTGRDLLHDIRSQVANFRHWREALAQLRKRGITGDLYQEIVAAGPSALPEIRALLTLSKADLTSYTRTFNRGQSMIDLATKQDMNLSLVRYRNYGKNIALQIIEGLRSEHTPLLKVFEDMILKDFPGLAKSAKGRAAATHHGTARNTVVPAHHNPPHHATVHKPRVTRTMSTATPTHVTYHDEPHYEVKGVSNESSVLTQLQHAHFQHKNRFHL